MLRPVLNFKLNFTKFLISNTPHVICIFALHAWYFYAISSPLERRTLKLASDTVSLGFVFANTPNLLVRTYICSPLHFSCSLFSNFLLLRCLLRTSPLPFWWSSCSRVCKMLIYVCHRALRLLQNRKLITYVNIIKSFISMYLLFYEFRNIDVPITLMFYLHIWL